MSWPSLPSLSVLAAQETQKYAASSDPNLPLDDLASRAC